ncbi:hypothetical protein ACF0H5_012666 [Mactra antiquata]
MGSRRKMTEREMKATALNKKEDRVLQKTFGTLNLEMSFTYNVISLHVRTVKANFRRLRDRVDKLKSYLTPEDITILRQLEEEGKFRPVTSFNVNAAMKIAAAARRLNLYPEGLKRSRSVMTSARKSSNDKLLPGRSKTDTNLLRKRSNSVTGVFIDAPPENEIVRRNSTDGPLSVTFQPVTEVPDEQETEKSTIKIPSVVRPVSAARTNLAEGIVAKKSNGSVRPSSSVGVEREQDSVLPKQTTPQKPQPEYGDLFMPNASDRVTETGTGKVKKSPRDKMALIDVNDEALDSGRSKIFEDRRQELLHDEQVYSKNLEKRKNTFIGKIDDYLIANPPVQFNTFSTLPIEISNSEEDEEQLMAYSRRRRNFRQYDSSRTFTSEEEYNKRQGELWQGMNKTRYLRVPDEKLDLSGVVTLAKDQMQLYKLLRSTEPSHIVTH